MLSSGQNPSAKTATTKARSCAATCEDVVFRYLFPSEAMALLILSSDVCNGHGFYSCNFSLETKKKRGYKKRHMHTNADTHTYAYAGTYSHRHMYEWKNDSRVGG